MSNIKKTIEKGLSNKFTRSLEASQKFFHKINADILETNAHLCATRQSANKTANKTASKVYASIAEHSFSNFIIGKFCGQVRSHLPQQIQSLALPRFAVAILYDCFPPSKLLKRTV